MAGDPVGVKANVVQKAVGDATAQRARGQKCCVFFFFLKRRRFQFVITKYQMLV